MKYLLFSHMAYESQGWDDFDGVFNSIEEAKAALQPVKECAQIVEYEGKHFKKILEYGQWGRNKVCTWEVPD